jgi:hypothetical protein
MSRGIALVIRNINGVVKIPDGSDGAPGSVIPVPLLNPDFPPSTLLHVICKEVSTERLQDTLGAFVNSYRAGYRGLASWCSSHGVKKLAMTPMGCRTDCLPDQWMESQIWHAFANQKINIIICTRPK